MRVVGSAGLRYSGLAAGQRLAKEDALVALSVSVEGLFGLAWPAWKRLIQRVEELGFTGLYLSDHFHLDAVVAGDSLEMVVALTYLADHTEHVRFGPMVAPLSFRDPVMLARQAAAVDALSGGRMVLGLGTGWSASEHSMFGYDLGDLPARFARFEEGLTVITRLLDSDEPIDFEGQHYRLQGALLPGPKRPGGPPVLIGGAGPKRTLPLVARFADEWNAVGGNVFLGPNEFRELAARLDRLLLAAGRRPEEVRRSLMVPVVCWRTSSELEDRLRPFRLDPDWRSQSTDQLLETLSTIPAILGDPGEVVEQILEFEAAGVQELIVQWFGVDDVEGLELLAAEVMPRLARASV
jgi:alkanesulfonate monooxygenase SsuD/methylene tetrahydromethanopterin reductase-like flavin-dependent oxidoreductase (luciferase family)